jgi:hypothetical protein
LVNNRGGTYVPTALIFARTYVRGFKLKLNSHLTWFHNSKNNERLQMNQCSPVADHSLREAHACHVAVIGQLSVVRSQSSVKISN